MDEDGNQDYLVNQFEFTEEMLPDTQTQLNDDPMLPEDHSLTTEEILGLHPNEDHGDDNITEINQQSPPFGDSLLLEAPSGEGDGPNQLKYEAQDRESPSDEHGRPANRESPSDEHGRPANRESPSDEHGRPANRESFSDEHGRPASVYTTSYEEYALLLEQLTEEQAHAIEHGKKLHTILAPVFAKKPKEEMERILQGEMQAESYEESLEILIELKRNMMEEREMAERLAEELRMQAQERLSKVDKEWRELLSLKKDVALMVLSRRTAKLDALAKVESALASEEMHQDELTRLRLQNFGLENRIRRLELELREADRNATNPYQREYEKLHTRRMERKKHREKRHEEAIRVQRRVMRSSEVLSNIKQRLHSTETQVQHQQEKLAQVNGILAQHRDKLTNIKRARSSQQRDNTRLKEQHGLLGNEVLLRDYDYTKQANAALEEKLQDLKCQQADLEFYLNRRKITFQTM